MGSAGHLLHPLGHPDEQLDEFSGRNHRLAGSVRISTSALQHGGTFRWNLVPDRVAAPLVCVWLDHHVLLARCVEPPRHLPDRALAQLCRHHGRVPDHHIRHENFQEQRRLTGLHSNT